MILRIYSCMYFCISWRFLLPFSPQIRSKYWVWIWSILKNEYWTWWIPQKINVTSHTHFWCSLTHPLVKKQLKHLWEEIFWLDDIFLNKLQIKQGHWNTIFSTSTFQLHFCIVHCKTNTVKSLLVAAATIDFRGFLLRLQLKGGHYLRAATIIVIQKIEVIFCWKRCKNEPFSSLSLLIWCTAATIWGRPLFQGFHQ